jgi:hypothetical protein
MTEGMTQAVEYLPSKHEVLISIPSTASKENIDINILILYNFHMSCNIMFIFFSYLKI